MTTATRPPSFWLAIGLFAVLQSNSTFAQQPSPSGKVALRVLPPQRTTHPGATFGATLLLNIEEGWHINAASPSDEMLIGTSVEVESGGILDSVAVRFPPGSVQTFGYAEEPIEVYEGIIEIPIVMHVADSVKAGVYRLRLKVGYQACNDRVCLAPAVEVIEFPLDISAQPGD